MKKRTAVSRTLTTIATITLTMTMTACSGEASNKAADNQVNQVQDTLVSAAGETTEVIRAKSPLREEPAAGVSDAAGADDSDIGIVIESVALKCADAGTIIAEYMEAASAETADPGLAEAETAGTETVAAKPVATPGMLTAADLENLETLLAKRFDCDMSDEQMEAIIGPGLTVDAFDDLVRYMDWNHLCLITSKDKTRSFLYLTSYVKPYGPCMWETASEEESLALQERVCELLKPVVTTDWSVHELIPGTGIDQAYIDWFCEKYGGGMPAFVMDDGTKTRWFRCIATWGGGGAYEISAEEAYAGMEGASVYTMENGEAVQW